MERMSKNPWSCATSAMKDAGELKGQLERGQQRQIEPGVTPTPETLRVSRLNTSSSSSRGARGNGRPIA